MTYTPVVAGQGLVAWQFLKATQETQRAVFDKSPTLVRDAEYFADRIGQVEGPDDLVNDRRLLRVALSAFGLEDQIDSKFLIKKVLEEGTESDEALANRLGDGRYLALAGAFNFEKVTVPQTQDTGFSDEIVARYEKNVLAAMEASLADSGDTETPYGDSVREQVALNIKTETAFFQSSIGSVSSAQGLINSPRLYTYALLAYGLEEKAGSTALIKRVLEQGTQDANDLANVLGDQRYVDLARKFSFDRDPFSPMSADGYADDIISDFFQHEFEVAVGAVDEGLRTALNFERAIPELAGRDSSDTTKWFQVLGTTSLSRVFKSALGLPSGFSQIDLDKQVEVLKDKMQTRFGIESFNEIAEPDVMETIIHTYLLQQQISQNTATANGQIALNLLQAIPRTSVFG